MKKDNSRSRSYLCVFNDVAETAPAQEFFDFKQISMEEVPADPWSVDIYIMSALSTCWMMLSPPNQSINETLTLTSRILRECIEIVLGAPNISIGVKLSATRPILASEAAKFVLPDGPRFVATQLLHAFKHCWVNMDATIRTRNDLVRIVKHMFDRQLNNIREDHELFRNR